jgi:hypothetical protein
LAAGIGHGAGPGVPGDGSGPSTAGRLRSLHQAVRAELPVSELLRLPDTLLVCDRKLAAHLHDGECRIHPFAENSGYDF